MHNRFADFYQPVTFGHSPEILKLRWEGVSEFINQLNYSQIQHFGCYQVSIV